MLIVGEKNMDERTEHDLFRQCLEKIASGCTNDPAATAQAALDHNVTCFVPSWERAADKTCDCDKGSSGH